MEQRSGTASEIQTPHALAARGLRYRHFTATAVCSPSRAALLTGLNHHSAGVGWLANLDAGFPGYRGEIAANALTLAEILRGGWVRDVHGRKMALGELRSFVGRRAV